MEVSSQLHTPAALPQEKSLQYPLGRRLGGPKSSVVMVSKRRIPSPYWESNPSHLIVPSIA